MKKAAKVLIVSVGAASVLGIGTAAALFNQVETLYGPPTDIPSLEDTASQARRRIFPPWRILRHRRRAAIRQRKSRLRHRREPMLMMK